MRPWKGPPIRFLSLKYQVNKQIPKIVFSVGTSARSIEEFINLLRFYGINTLVDVRRFPTSRFEHFKKETLQKLVEEAGINYLYIGKELGGYRKGGYETHMRTEDFLSGIEELEGNARVDRTIFVCAERLPWRCHRRFIGQVLEKKGWEVIHIIDEKRVWRPKD